jgi:FAD/FMN-containing dehydrogenase
MLEARHISALRDLLGPRGVLTDAPDMAAYETGARYDQGRAALVLRPSSTEEVSAVVSFSSARGSASFRSRAIPAWCLVRRRICRVRRLF